MSDAIKWADGEDPNRRVFAADVLQDIGTPDAIEYLRTLSNDTDRTVAAIAKIDLGDVGRGSILNTVDQEKVEQPLAESPPK
jgi:HEAT repeat protein